MRVMAGSMLVRTLLTRLAAATACGEPQESTKPHQLAQIEVGRLMRTLT